MRGRAKKSAGLGILLVGYLALTTALFAGNSWQELRGCTFIPHEWNDGDSFHTQHEGAEYIVRLYLVDCPESENSFPERVAQQAPHFGTSSDRMIEIGRYAKVATAQMLSRPFTVATRFQKALGRSNLQRYYAFVRTVDDEDLGEELLRNGLARAHGSPVRLPDGRDIQSDYAAAEDHARIAKVGAWGKGQMGESILRADAAPAIQKPTVAEAGLPDAKTNRPVPTTPEFKAIGKAEKISLNNGSKTQLMSLPGIGETLALRIMESRPFGSVSDLKNVRGIGDARYSAIEGMIEP